MPNHVTTKLTIRGDNKLIQAFIDQHIIGAEGEKQFDFNTIIPMPEVLQGSESSSSADMGLCYVTGEGLAKYLTYPWVREAGVTDFHSFRKFIEEKHPDYIALGRTVKKAIEDTGFKNWYDWSCANWDTKWNSYSLSYDDLKPEERVFVMKFDTAWSYPLKVMEKLDEMHPDLDFSVVFFDEGWNFAGHGDAACPDFVDANAVYYEAVYGEPPAFDEDEEEDD